MADEPKGCGGQRNFKVYIAGFRKICPHSWDSFPPPPAPTPQYTRCGLELAAKALVLMSAMSVLMWMEHESVLILHFSLHAEKLANINKEKVNKGEH